MGDMRDVFDAYREMHKERVAQNPSRIEYAERQLQQNGITYIIKNYTTCHFHCWRKSDDKLIQFWAGTGKIMGYKRRGIKNLIKLCRENK